MGVPKYITLWMFLAESNLLTSLHSGQGVVLERSPHSDFVFANAMRAKNYIGPECMCFGAFLLSLLKSIF